jgi:hypothetical protein
MFISANQSPRAKIRPYRRGVTLIEVLFALLILMAFLVPAGSLFFQSSRLQQRSKQETLAHLVSHRVMEKIISFAKLGLDKIPSHSDWNSIIPEDNLKLSPYFLDFSSSRQGMIAADFPVLSHELKFFKLKVELRPAKELENESKIRHVAVTVQWPTRQGNATASILMETLVSNLLEI